MVAVPKQTVSYGVAYTWMNEPHSYPLINPGKGVIYK